MVNQVDESEKRVSQLRPFEDHVQSFNDQEQDPRIQLTTAFGEQDKPRVQIDGELEEQDDEQMQQDVHEKTPGF